MAGITRLSAPKRRRLSAVQPRPMRPAGRFPRLCHCSRNSTTKRAVRAKSMPVLSKGRTPPARAPAAEPSSQ